MLLHDTQHLMVHHMCRVCIELPACVLMEISSLLCIPLYWYRHLIACVQLCKTAHRSEFDISFISLSVKSLMNSVVQVFIPGALDTNSEFKKRSILMKPQSSKSLVTNLNQFSLVHILPAYFPKIQLKIILLYTEVFLVFQLKYLQIFFLYICCISHPFHPS